MADGCKVRDTMKDPRSAWARYRALVHGDVSTSRVLRDELIQLLCGALPGALGLLLRAKLYPSLFRACGRGVVFGRSLTLRHAGKITLGDGCIIDDYVLLDAKGTTNSGIALGAQVYVGRHSLIYCKNGDIRVGDRVNLSANCTLFSSNQLELRPGTMVGAYSYFLSGGSYDYRDPTPFAEQRGTGSTSPLTIGADCWFGARVTVVDGAAVGDRCVIGAGAVVTHPVPPHSLAVGVPARVVKSI